jgi:hypothetical protein
MAFIFVKYIEKNLVYYNIFFGLHFIFSLIMLILRFDIDKKIKKYNNTIHSDNEKCVKKMFKITNCPDTIKTKNNISIVFLVLSMLSILIAVLFLLNHTFHYFKLFKNQKMINPLYRKPKKKPSKKQN